MDVLVEIRIKGKESTVLAMASTVEAIDDNVGQALPAEALEYLQDVAQGAADEIVSTMDQAKRETLREVQRSIAEMVADGMLEPTNEWRPGPNGTPRPVYRITAKGRSDRYDDAGNLVKRDATPPPTVDLDETD